MTARLAALALAASLSLGATGAVAQEASSDPGTQPRWGVALMGVSLFTSGYATGSTVVFALEASMTCGTSSPHSTRCDRRPLAFVPFAHYLGGGDIPGWLVGIAATSVEGVGVIIAIIGLCLQRSRTPIELTAGPRGSQVGLGLRILL